MSHVSVTIHGRQYRMACEDGQEDHLVRLAKDLDTEREEEVLSLVAKGKSNREIARQLYVSLKTVRNHVSNILLKLQVADRTQAVIRARDVGLG